MVVRVTTSSAGQDLSNGKSILIYSCVLHPGIVLQLSCRSAMLDHKYVVANASHTDTARRSIMYQNLRSIVGTSCATWVLSSIERSLNSLALHISIRSDILLANIVGACRAGSRVADCTYRYGCTNHPVALSKMNMDS